MISFALKMLLGTFLSFEIIFQSVSKSSLKLS